MTDEAHAYSYSFACPFCHGSWRFEEFAGIAKDVFSGWDGVGVCPRCGGRFSWKAPGELQGRRWYEGLTRYTTNGRCAHCGKAIDGRRKYCSVNCRQAAYYRRKKKSTSTTTGVEITHKESMT